MTDEEAVKAAVARLSNVPEFEVRRINANWRSLRKRAMNPAETIGWKY